CRFQRRGLQATAAGTAGISAPSSRLRAHQPLPRLARLAHHRLAGREGEGADRGTNRLRDPAAIRLSASLDRRRPRNLGQSLHDASRPALRRHPAPRPAPHDGLGPGQHIGAGGAAGSFRGLTGSARQVHGVMLSLRLAMIQIEPVITRKTISRPNARARILFVLSGPLPRCRKKTRWTPICAKASTTSPTGIPGAHSKFVCDTTNEAIVSPMASPSPAVYDRKLAVDSSR